ncbi:MAG: DUF177 domain-containing protein [Dehalococcoidia bacterium]
MSVRYNVSTLLQEPIGAVREQAIDSRVLVGDEPTVERVHGAATLLRTKAGVLVTAGLQGTSHDQCSRCLKAVDVPMRLAIREEFAASVDANTGMALPAPEDPDMFRIDASHMLDLEEAIRQTWTAVLPMKPLCRPDCAGLCPRCGRDLNLGACGCRPEADERWSALRALAHELERK